MANGISGGACRPSGGRVSRFSGTASHALRSEAELGIKHPAVVEGRTLFRSSVVAPADAPRLLVSGFNSATIGKRVTKGPWRGMPIYTLTLEERATCPISCGHWRSCFGNAMPFARRHRADKDLVPMLEAELSWLLAKHPRGLVIRLHVLGDFFSVGYAAAWAQWMRFWPALRVFGYSHHSLHSPIGRVVYGLNGVFPDRWAMRHSVEPGGIRDMEATTIWRQPEAHVVPEGLICPAQQHKTAACASCALCWSPAMRDTRIVFVGRGLRHKRGPHLPPDNLIAKRIDHAGGPRVVAAGMGFGLQAIQRWRKTGIVPVRQIEALDALLDQLGHRQSQMVRG